MQKQLFRRGCAAAMLVLSALLVAPVADATVLTGVYTNRYFTDTFTLNNADPTYGSRTVTYDLISDSHGSSYIVFGGSGGAQLYPPETIRGYIEFSPTVYDGSNPFTLEPGTYNGTAGGQTATLTLTAVPEPGTWALMAVGAGLVGAATRAARRKRPAGLATALA